MSDIFESDQSEMQQQEDGGDENAKTMRNSKHKLQIRYTDKGDEAAVEQLNRKFEELMGEYRVSHDVLIRKQCVHVAKQIKQLKQEIQRRKEYDSHSNTSRRKGPHAAEGEYDKPNQYTQIYHANGQRILTRVRST